MTKMYENEKELSDNTPIYYGYLYVVDNEAVRNLCFTQSTIFHLKKELGVNEIKNCCFDRIEDENLKLV